MFIKKLFILDELKLKLKLNKPFRKKLKTNRSREKHHALYKERVMFYILLPASSVAGG